MLGPAARDAGLVPLINIFNLGDSQNYARQMAACSALSDQFFPATVALVVEIVLPDDESWAKLDFCAAHDVDDLLIVDPQKREVHWLGLRSDRTL